MASSTNPTTTTSKPLRGRLNGKACLPQQYLVDFLRMLHDRRDEIDVITYADLPWDDDWDYANNYLDEYRRWKKRVKTRRRDRKIYVLLQHDVDQRPERTLAILREQERLAIRSNVMIFNRRVERNVLRKTGEVRFGAYDLDDDYLRHLETRGFVIGYHSNAYEQSGFDAARAAEIFTRDVRELRARFDIRFFCPHGGIRDADGQSNAALDLPESERRSLRWVLNRHTVRFDGVYSDGAINGKNRDATERDLRDFVRRWKPGNRYRVLTHPQYYHTEYRRPRRLAEAAWYRQVLACYEGDPPTSAWR